MDHARPQGSQTFPEAPAPVGRPAAGRRNVRTLTKAELADTLFDRLGLNKREAKDMVDGFFDEIRAALERGDSVKLSGFGNFQARRQARKSPSRRGAS